LKAAVERGVIFFRQVGNVTWKASDEPALGSGLTYAVIRRKHISRLSGIKPLVEGEWSIISGNADYLTRMLCASGAPLAPAFLRVVGGIRVGPSWLGRVGFLPVINSSASSTQLIKLSPLQDGEAIESDSVGAFRPESPLEGPYELTVQADRNSRALAWSRRIRFRANAVPYSPDSMGLSRDPPIGEWQRMRSCELRIELPDDLAWDSGALGVADLLEAIYARSRGGLHEAEIIDLISRADRSGGLLWDILRSLQESTFLEPRQRQLWRGRVWTLRPPVLNVVRSRDGTTVVASGAICADLECEFHEVATSMGATPFRRVSDSPWAPALIGARFADSKEMARRLGWLLGEIIEVPDLDRLFLETSDMVAEDHILAATWCWRRRRFVAGHGDFTDVTLTRWVHPSRRDHDVYRVRSSTHRSAHKSRMSAILMAHQVAGASMFAINECELIRESAEGALPVEVAQYLRLRRLTNSGPLNDGSYKYFIGPEDGRDFCRSLHACIRTLQPSRSSTTQPRDEVTAVRRSGWRKRLTWNSGKLEIRK
jgi:hypothetical protein